MVTVKYFTASGDADGTRDLPEDFFDGTVNRPVLHQVVKAYLANQRQGTSASKSRGMVRGGGRKIWRQKGTGRARQGSIRAPHWTGGGAAFGPTPRSYEQRTPRKVRALARRSAFNLRAGMDAIAVIAGFEFDEPKTGRASSLLARIGMGERKLLILTDGINENLFLSVRNLKNVRVMPFAEASAYDVMRATEVLIEEAALDSAASKGEEVVNA